jgi:hypothetical protein
VTDPFQLSEHDKAQGLWLRLKSYLEGRLADARKRNDDMSLPEYDTAALRGEIRTLKRLIALDAARPVMTGSDDGQPPD